MITCDDPQLDAFRAMASEMHESAQEKGHLVTKAMDLDACFTSGQARSGLRRDILRQAACRVASEHGIDFRYLGEGTEFRTLGTDHTYRRFRLRSATRDADNNIVIQHNSQSSLLDQDDDDPLWGPKEVWVLGFVQRSDDYVEEVFLARVAGVAEGRPGHLILDSFIPLTRPTRPPTDFEPDDEDLMLPDEDDDEASGSTAA